MRSLQGWVYVTVWFFSLQWEFGLEVSIPVLWDTCRFRGERKGGECGK